MFCLECFYFLFVVLVCQCVPWLSFLDLPLSISDGFVKINFFLINGL